MRFINMRARKFRRISGFILAVLLSLTTLTAGISGVSATTDLGLDAVSAILIDSATGTVLYEQNADAPLPPASVTKVMTLLLVMEAIDGGSLKLEDTVTASETAASMGGSQIFLKAGEEMTVEDMLKAVVIASANDCAVALAEHIAGSETAFVALMNERAAELGLTSTHFENTNGLDDTTTDHVMSARDIAVISRELLAHPLITKYSSIWMDTVRGGAFGLTNTNRLVRFYRGTTGLKTGSTSRAKFCISATAERDGMHLIAVIMASPTRDIRNAAAKSLLDYGFSNFALYKYEAADCGDIAVTGGIENAVGSVSEPFAVVVPKNKAGKIEASAELPEIAAAPVAKGETVGRVTFTCDGEVIGESAIKTSEAVDRISYAGVLGRLLAHFLPG